jgi:pimeloyl-ACP methyl ester carboxylesterase
VTTFVLVPGGWHGGWYFRPIAEALRSAGRTAYAVTLTGLGERAHLRTAATNLDTHIEDVVAVLEAEEITDAVLVGHSYGGMVITGAADRCPERVARLVYADAYVPRHGESCWDLTTPAFREVFVSRAAADGHCVQPPPGLDPRATAHPLASLLQKIRLNGHRPPPRRDFLHLGAWAGSPFTGLHDRLARDPAWRTRSVPAPHDVVRHASDALLEILLAP